MPNSLYPPLLSSTQPAFLYTIDSYPIYFKLQSMMTLSQIKHIQVQIVQQVNNRTVVNTTAYPDGIMYKEASSITQEANGEYKVEIKKSDLAGAWIEGVIYKVQIRFGSSELWGDVSRFADWKQEQIENQTFSEWSTVMVIKAIGAVTTTVVSASAINAKEKNLSPLFLGTVQINGASRETEDKYKFDLYSGTSINIAQLIETTGWLQHNGVSNSIDTHRFTTRLIDGQAYTVVYSIETINGYTTTSSPYTITVEMDYITGLEDAILEVDDSSPYARENACIRLYLTLPQPLTQTLVVTRSDESTNFQSWEDLIFINPSTIHTNNFNQALIHTDFTIESGIGYKYAVQLQDISGKRTNPKQEEGSPIRFVGFDYSYLFCNGIQLKLMLNQTMNSFKHTVLSSVQNTLGSQYPYILKNGYAYYAEFPINGLISIQMDEDGTFFELTPEGYKYEGKVVIPNRYVPELQRKRVNNSSQEIAGDYEDRGINLTRDNFYVERKFREKVEEFLNNYKYKLYKSPSEGNFIVVLTNIQLAPNATLGRMIFSFSGTAYEVDKVTLEKLEEYGIITRGTELAAAASIAAINQDLSQPQVQLNRPAAGGVKSDV